MHFINHPATRLCHGSGMENVRPAPLPSPWIVAPLATALALWVLPVINTDLREALVPWLGILVVKGPIAAFATPFF